MGHLAEESSQEKGPLDAECVEGLGDGRPESAPFQMRLFTKNHDEIAVRVMKGMKLVQGPVNGPYPRLGHLDLGPPRLELVELIRIDPGEGVAFEGGDEMAGGVGRGIAGVAPASESQNGHGVAQFRMADPFKVRHEDTLSDHGERRNGRQGLSTESTVEEFDSSCPRDLRRLRIVVFGPVVIEEGVPGSRIHEEFCAQAEFLQLALQLQGQLGTGPVIVLGIVALKRCHRTLEVGGGFGSGPSE